MTNITAIYTRLALADDTAIKAHERKLLDYAKRNGYGNCACYRDNGQSGLSPSRPSLQAMLDDVKSGGIGVVIVLDLARLSRNYWRLDEIVTALTANDVLLISIANSGVVNGIE
jgi:DNA invertase Pin-like site-specific DNA recombinase